jgi:colanic acid/amylovoran biosynthesis glycosyltransferase
VVGLQAKGHRVSVCAMTPSKHSSFYAIRMHEWSKELDILPFSLTGFKKIFSITLLLLQNSMLFLKNRQFVGLKKGILNTVYEVYFTKNNPDIIHFAYSGIGVQFLNILPYLKNKNIKIVTSCRGTAEKVRPIVEPIRKEELRQLFSLCDIVHCVSVDMMEGLMKYGLQKDKSFVNYPSINIDFFKREIPYFTLDKKNIKIVTTGRLHFSKGYIFCLQALKIVKENGFEFTYTIIGDGPDLHQMKYLIDQFGLNDQIILKGKVNSTEVKKILLESDIFILPSLYEGIANAALEAMALQLPLISTKCGGMEEVIENEVNGMLVNRFDENELANAIINLIQNPVLRMKISNASRTIIEEKFKIENQLIVFEENYLKVLIKNSTTKIA